MPKLPKPLAFVLKFFLFYFCLMLLANVSGFRKGFRHWFASMATERYESYIPQTKATFTPIDLPGEQDMNIDLLNMKEYKVKLAAAQAAGTTNVNIAMSGSPFSTWDYFLLPFIVLYALMLAWPQPWKRKAQTFIIGSILLLIFTWFRFRCMFWYIADHSSNLEPLHLGSFQQSFLNGWHNVQSVEFIFITSLLIWMLATLRKEDFAFVKKR